MGSVSSVLGEELGWGPTRGRERILEGCVLSWEAEVGGRLDLCPKEAWTLREENWPRLAGSSKALGGRKGGREDSKQMAWKSLVASSAALTRPN